MHRPRLFAGDIRRAIVTLLLLALVPVLVVQTVLFAILLRRAQATENENNLEVARVAAVAFEEFIRDVLHEELTIGIDYHEHPPTSLQQFNADLGTFAREFPAVTDFAWVNPRGRVVAAGDPRARGINLVDRRYFRDILIGKPWVVSDLLISRATGIPTLIVVRAVRDARGTLRGVVLAAIDPDKLAEVFTIRRTAGATIAFIDRQGMTVFRYPQVRMSLSERRWMQAQPLTSRALAGQEDTGVFTSPIDQLPRVAAVTPIPFLNWAAMATRPQGEVMAPLLRDFLTQLVLLLLTASLALLGAILISRGITTPLERMQWQALAIGRGEFNQRFAVLGPQEVRNLAAAFNRMVEELHRREIERDVYIHAISHDLRAPLTIATGHAQLVRESLQSRPSGDSDRESMMAILRALRRMNLMIQDLVDSARIEASQLQLRRQPLALSVFVTDLLARARTLLDVTRVQVQIPAELPPVLADADRLERILLNLLSNAMKYSASGTPVVISAHPEGEMIAITVTDHGPGIPPEELPHLFERFYRARETHAVEGIGLGLFITRRLVEAHGGDIRVDSIPNQGSTFTFTLPRG